MSDRERSEREQLPDKRGRDGEALYLMVSPRFGGRALHLPANWPADYDSRMASCRSGPTFDSMKGHYYQASELRRLAPIICKRCLGGGDVEGYIAHVDREIGR